MPIRPVTAAITEKRSCTVCRSDALDPVLDLPDFPLTGLYVSARDSNHSGIDQGLVVCGRCGHAQLQNVIDPGLLYADTYTHRSGSSPIATAGNDFFAQFLDDIAGGSTFQRVVEVGCNDLYLLNKVADKGETLFGIDPIWQGQAVPEGTTVHVIGKFIEQVDFQRDIGGAPDLILSAHTFEHIGNAAEQLGLLLEAAGDDALFVVEVPAFESLLRLCRFDQVFHQHVQYFSLASFRHMLARLGGRYVAHRYNYRYWGGTLLIAFRKGGGKDEAQEALPRPTAVHVAERISLFRQQIDLARSLLDSAGAGPLYGYGAAQMLPTLAYHMKTDFACLKAVLDDNEERQGLYYPNLAPPIESPADKHDIAEATVVVTALDSAWGILARSFSLGARDILLPLHVV